MLELKKLLVDNPIYIENILTKLEFHKIKVQKNEIVCGNSSDGKGMSIHIKLDENISCRDYKYNVKGDLICFLMNKRNLEFKDVLNIIKSEIGIDHIDFYKEKNNDIFCGIYKKIKKCLSNNLISKKLEESILDQYKNKYNSRFLKDGITLTTQKKFSIGFDVESQRITIPWRDYEGDLIGITGRTNLDIDDIAKYLPIIPFPKSNYLYGFSENYSKIQESEILLIGEAEKFPLQIDSMNIDFGSVSVGCHSISSIQAKNIVSLFPSKIIICFDEDVSDEEYLKEQCKLLKYKNRFVNCKIGYILDKENKYLPKGSKCSPTDLGKEIFMKLYSECIIWEY